MVGFFCAVVPQELIAAFGAVPIRLCAGFATTPHRELPRDACPIVASSYRLLGESNFHASEIDGIIVPKVCDWKSQFADLIAGRFRVFRLEVPFKKREAAAQSERLRSLRLLCDFLREITGEGLSRNNLLRSIKSYQRANSATRRLVECMLDDNPGIRGSDVLLAMNMSFFDDVASWADGVMRLAAEAERTPREGEEKSKLAPRLLLTGAPIIWPNWKVPEIIEECGGEIVAEELCSGARIFYDPVKADETTRTDMLLALAERYSLPCTCPCFVPNEDRVYRLISLAERFRADGVIYHNLRTCYLYHMEAEAIRKRFREPGIPFLEIETDHSPEGREQLAVRIEAFVEMLRGSKGRRG